MFDALKLYVSDVGKRGSGGGQLVAEQELICRVLGGAASFAVAQQLVQIEQGNALQA
ncbi:MAG: hypothetical protein AAGG57_14730 [Pseudomonadota bacterium]